jgi:chemotaxis protein MotB
MKKYITPFIVMLSLASCIPPGKLSESLDANTLLTKKYDTLNNKLNDTVASFKTSLSNLKGSINNLKDSVTYYRSLVAARPTQTQGDVFLNQMFGYSLLSTSELAGIKAANISNNANNAWLESFKSDVKKYSIADVDIKLNKGYVFVDIPSNILFTTGSATLSSKSIEMLGGIARLLEAQPNLNFLIEGHTDNRAFSNSSNNDNWVLSVNRAAAVAKILQNKYKINPKRIIAAGRSQYVPIDDNKTKAGRLNNRRIRIVIMPTVTEVMNLSK